MTNEELKAQIAAVASVEDAYSLAKESGFEGTLEDFIATCEKVSAAANEAMKLDDMESVAGGNAFTDTVSKTAENVWTWMKENPYETAAIGAAAAGTIAAVAVGVHYLRGGSQQTIIGPTGQKMTMSEWADLKNEGGLNWAFPQNG